MERCESAGQCERRGIVGEADPQSPQAAERNELRAADGGCTLMDSRECRSRKTPADDSSNSSYSRRWFQQRSVLCRGRGKQDDEARGDARHIEVKLGHRRPQTIDPRLADQKSRKA
jgi:hypothetical protein